MEDEISSKEAADILGVRPRQVQWYYHKKLLPGRMVVGRLVFKRSDVLTFKKPEHPLGRWAKKDKPSAAKSAKEKPAPKAKKKKGKE